MTVSPHCADRDVMRVWANPPHSLNAALATAQSPFRPFAGNRFGTEGSAINGHSPMQPGSSSGLTCESLRIVVQTVITLSGPEG